MMDLDATGESIIPIGADVDATILAAILDDHHPVKMAAAEFARTNLDDPNLISRDHDCEFWDAGWAVLADAGIVGMLVDPVFGGQAHSLCEALLTIEGLGLGCRDDGLVFALSSQVLTMQLTLERFGTDAQKSAWLPKLVAGETFGAFSMSEPGSGSDAYALTTTAKRAADGSYRIDGEKAWVTMAPCAGVLIVFANTNPDLGRWGITAFVVPTDTPGLQVGENRPKMGMRTTPFANVVFDGCVVPDSARMGSEGAGASIFSAAMESERAFLLAGAIGNLERTLGDAVAYAKERRQFGEAIGAFQGVSHPIADIKIGLESARTLMYKAAALEQLGKPSMISAAIAKLVASEAALAGALTSIQVHGAVGYVTESEVERDVRNTLGGVIYGGSSAIQKNIIARLLGLPGRDQS